MHVYFYFILALVLVAMFYAVFLTMCYFVIVPLFRKIFHSSSTIRSSRPQPNAGNVNQGFRPSPSPSRTEADNGSPVEAPPAYDTTNIPESCSQSQLVSPPPSPPVTPLIATKPRQRLRSLDTFRG